MSQSPPAFAEFYATVATLVPVLLVSQLVWFRSLASRTVGAFRRTLLSAWLPAIALLVVFAAIVRALDSLAGFEVDRPTNRLILIVLILAQVMTAGGGFAASAGRSHGGV